MSLQSLQLFEQLQIDHKLSVGEIDQLVTQQVREDLYLEYKHGDELNKSDASNTIREYLSAFANSAGGVLIIGIEESKGVPTRVTGCAGHSKGALDEWAARCITPIANYFSPLPKFHVVKHPNGEVLIGIAHRSLGLVPCTKAGNILYHFRFHDQTLKAPDYLLADLLLGRRQHPVLEITEWRAVNFQKNMNNSTNAMDLEFQLGLRLENNSFVWGEGSRWGLIAWVNSFDNRYGLEIIHPSNHLLSFIDVQEIVPDYDPCPKQLIHASNPTNIDKPFDTQWHNVRLTIPLRIHNRWFTYIWKAALYFITKNSLPIWYQVSFEIDQDTIQIIDRQNRIAVSDKKIEVTKKVAERPVVCWQNF